MNSHDGGRDGGSLNSEKWKNLHLSLTAYRRNSKSIKESNRGTMPLNQLKICAEPALTQITASSFGFYAQNNSKQKKIEKKSTSFTWKAFAEKGQPERKEKDNPQSGKMFATEVKERNSSPNMQTAHIAQGQKNSQPSRKTGQDLNGHLSKEGMQMTKTHRKRCWASLLEKCWSNPQWGIAAHRSEWPVSELYKQ